MDQNTWHEQVGNCPSCNNNQYSFGSFMKYLNQLNAPKSELQILDPAALVQRDHFARAHQSPYHHQHRHLCHHPLLRLETAKNRDDALQVLYKNHRVHHQLYPGPEGEGAERQEEDSRQQTRGGRRRSICIEKAGESSPKHDQNSLIAQKSHLSDLCLYSVPV